MTGSASLFVAIPAYEESAALKQTTEFFRARTAGPHTIRTCVARQSVVANKNILLDEARQSGAAYIAISDDDVEPQAGWDQALIAGMEEVSAHIKRPVGQSAPRMLLPDGRLFSLWADVHLDRDASKSWVKPVKYAQPDSDAYQAKLFVGAVPGTLSVFSRAALDAMQWRFDDRYLQSQYDDIDQSLECRRRGFEVLYNGYVSIVHHTVQATPRAANENYTKLLQKWSQHPEQSLIVAAGPRDIREASRRTAGQAPTLSFRARRLLKKFRRPFQTP